MTEAEAHDEQGIDATALAALLRRQYDDADSYYSRLAQLTNQAFQYYEAQPFGNEIDGRSQIVLPDVQETIDYMQQSVLRTFVSGDHTVEFEATDESDAQAVEDATAGVNYIFMRQQDGFRILHDGLYDGLLKKLGVFKTVVETVEKVSREQVRSTEEQLALAVDQHGIEVEGYQDNGDGTVTAAIRHERREKRFVDYAIPLSEFRFNPLARHEDEADYLCHVSEKTRSDLVEMGFDVDQVYALPTHNQAPQYDKSESDTLDSYVREQNSKALETVLLCEEYARVDLDGDGIAERVKCFRVENEILIEADTKEPSIETVDDQPFAVFCPFPRPHRMVGYSLADKVMHIQYQRSFVGRQLFDGLALTNMPRPVVDSSQADADTYDDILTPIPGSPVRIKGGMASLGVLPHNFDPQKSLAVMEWITGERESLTGITRLNQGLDADALNKTATGTALMQAQGQQNEEAIARQFAETIGRLFCKKYRLMKAEGEPFSVKVDGTYKQVDPSQWPDDINVLVKVGLGSNSKDKRIGYRMAMAEALQGSVMEGTSGPEHVFKWFDGMARDCGLGQGDDFAYDPDSDEGKAAIQQRQQQPDPKAEAAQAKAQADQAKVQQQGAIAGAQLEQKAQHDAQSLAQRHEAAMAQVMQREHQSQRDALLEQQRQERETALELRQQDLQAETARHVAKQRSGGKLDA